jgi:hypothetical protein
MLGVSVTFSAVAFSCKQVLHAHNAIVNDQKFTLTCINFRKLSNYKTSMNFSSFDGFFADLNSASNEAIDILLSSFNLSTGMSTKTLLKWVIN